jgi:hypothetical protein
MKTTFGEKENLMKAKTLNSLIMAVGLILQMLSMQVNAQVSYPEDGWWWDAEAPGRGYFIERQKNTIFIAAFIYTDDGNPEWLTSDGEYTPAVEDSDSIGSYTGNVYRSNNGQCIGCEYMPPTTVDSEQSPLNITFKDNQIGVLEWFGESITISRLFWSWADAVDQLTGTWLLTELENNETLSQLVSIERNDLTGSAPISNAFSGAEIGSVELLDGDLVLTLIEASENALPLVIPESKRFYAGFEDSSTLQVIAVRLDDLPLGDTDTSGIEGSTFGVLCNYIDITPNSQESLSYTSTSKWTCSDNTRVLAANGIPDHDVGTFPNANNPNTITEQSVSASYPLEPTESVVVTELGGPRGVTGYVLNGVKIDADTAGSCDDSGNNCSLIGNNGNWSIEALGQTSFNFGTDDNNAHVQPSGAYHYHGMPEGFVAKQGGNSSTMTIIGWAADGFPIYARYGYSITDDASSELKSMTGSYQLVSNVSNSRPSTDTYSLGTFSQDWEYVEGSGDLDECNGRVGVTPEFPDGIYHYYATDSYPYFQRCVKGSVL